MAGGGMGENEGLGSSNWELEELAGDEGAAPGILVTL